MIGKSPPPVVPGAAWGLNGAAGPFQAGTRCYQVPVGGRGSVARRVASGAGMPSSRKMASASWSTAASGCCSLRHDGSALFILVGAEPRTGWLPGTLARDDAGFLLTGPDLPSTVGLPTGWTAARSPLPMETSVPAVFAAGDVRHGSTKRVAAAVGEDVSAVQSAHRHFEQIADTRRSIRPP